MCFRCGIEVGSFLHCTWLCAKVRSLWYDFCHALTKITRVTFPLDPELCLLGKLTTFNGSLTKIQTKFVEISSCVARKCIAMTWKSDSPTLMDRWYVEINSCIPLEKITYSLRKRYKLFLNIWQPYLEYMDTMLTVPEYCKSLIVVSLLCHHPMHQPFINLFLSLGGGNYLFTFNFVLVYFSFFLSPSCCVLSCLMCLM